MEIKNNCGKGISEDFTFGAMKMLDASNPDVEDVLYNLKCIEEYFCLTNELCASVTVRYAYQIIEKVIGTVFDG